LLQGIPKMNRQWPTMVGGRLGWFWDSAYKTVSECRIYVLDFFCKIYSLRYQS